MSERNRTPYESVLDMVGWTPLVRLNSVTDGCRTPVWGKCEFMNPGGSVKDRIGLAMIEAAEKSGALKPGGTIVEATSGNTGLALAMAASIRGYRCIFTMPDKMSNEKVKLLRSFGAEVVIVPTAVPPDHPEHYTVKAKSIVKATPGAVLADQFYNPANPQAHYESTGPELWEQTGGRITHFFAGAGTGGTITGTARFLKEKNADVQICGVDPEGSLIAPFFNTGEMVEGHPYKVEGLGSDKIVDNLDLNLVDEYTEVSDQASFRMARRLTREEGLFVGGSAGLIVHAAVEKAKQLDDPDACVVAILCDWGEHYLTKLFDEEWMRENGFIERRQRRSAGELVAAKGDGAEVLYSIEPTTSVQMALSTMATHGVSQLPVIEGEDCVGAVAESELMAAVLEDTSLLDRASESVMGAPYPVVESGSDGDEVTRLLTHRAPAVLVRSEGSIDGIVTRFDVVRDLTQTRG